MSDRFVESFVEKLILLEKAAGANVQYRIMPPFTAPFHDHLSIQDTAKKIAEFIGLTGYTFIVAITKQDKNVHGHIDLSSQGTGVFVEVEEKMMKFPDAIGAILCHEACHKWLQVHGIASPIEAENEILTDITSVFLGLGKIMLNGCKSTNVRRESIANGTRTTTETQTSGYLDRDQLAFVYRLVCAMRNISRIDIMRGLNVAASQAVKSCDSLFGHYYDDRFHDSETFRHSANKFHERITTLQHDLAELNKLVTYMKKSLCETVDDFLKKSHAAIHLEQRKTTAMAMEAETDPALHFLRAIQKEFELDQMRKELTSVGNDTESFLRHAKAISRHINRNSNRFPVPSSGTFAVVECPKDGTKLRLPENSGKLIATCPTCKYRFAYSTAIPALSDPTPSSSCRSTWKTLKAWLLRQ